MPLFQNHLISSCPIKQMKVKTIEIAWHRRPEATHNDPVFSVDFLNDSVFATGGGDHEVKVYIQSSI